MRSTRMFMVTALLGLALTAAPATAQRTTINVGYQPLISYAPFFIALEKGYYRDQGLEVNLARFGHSGQMMGPMTSGEMQVGSGGISAGLFNAAAEGLRHKVVADKGYMFKGYGFNFVVMRKDLADVIKDFRDFKGRTIGMNAAGSPVRFYLHEMLKRGGLTEKDIRPLYLDFAKMPVALKEKGVDLAMIVDPHGTRAVQAGYAAIFRNTNQEPIINQQVAVIYYAESFMKNKPDLARKFMVAYVKACRYYNDQRNLPELAKFMAKHTGVPEASVLQGTLSGIHPEGRVDVESIMVQQEFWASIGEIKKKVRADDIIDMSYVEYANKVLGPIR